MIPADENKIMWLTTEMKRIRSKIHSADYVRKRDKAIKAAEAERLAGGLWPVYLAGVKFPWLSDHGQAPRAYDEDKIDEIKEQIEKIVDDNAALCQLEYTAQKGGPRGQGKR